MKSLNNEILIINHTTKLLIKSKALFILKQYISEYDPPNVLLIIDNFIKNYMLPKLINISSDSEISIRELASIIKIYSVINEK